MRRLFVHANRLISTAAQNTTTTSEARLYEYLFGVGMDSSASEPLSKRARKRVEKQEKMKELREQKKLKKLAEKEEKGAEKSEEHEIKPYENEIKWEPLPFEGPAFLRQEKKVKLQESFRKGCSGVTIAIDCAFESYMNESEKIVS